MANMLTFLYNLQKKLGGHKLGAGWYPVPQWLKRYIVKYPKSRQIAIVTKILKGTDLSFLVPGEVGCAEAVSRVIHEVLPDFPIITGTATLDRALSRDYRFRAVLAGEEIQAGDIIVSPTGSGNGNLSNGHTGIFVEGKRIYNNNSDSEQWLPTYTQQAWAARYKLFGGFPMNVYRLIK